MQYLALLLLGLSVMGSWAQSRPTPLKAGDRSPPFRAVDQDGEARTFQDLAGPKGLLLLFHKSADWCGSCKGQIVELSQARDEFSQQGLNVAAVSYDAVEILKKFAATRSIAIPLLSDPEFEMIKSFNAKMPLGDYAYPGYYIINAEGVITYSLFFEDDNEVGARSTPLAVLGRIFPATLNRAARQLHGQRLKLELSQSDEEARWRNRITLRVGIELPDGFHAYAPEVTGGYRPLKLEIVTTDQYWSLPPVIYPKARVLDFPKLSEKQPVYEGKLQLTTEIAVKWSEFERVKKDKRPHEIEVRGVLHYQICDASVCFAPTNTPVSWKVRVMPYDDDGVSPKRTPQ